jgi:hypothetical protein
MTAKKEDQTAAAKEPEAQLTIPAVFLTNCKHDKDLYRAGQRVDLPEAVYAELLQAKAIRQVGE